MFPELNTPIIIMMSLSITLMIGLLIILNYEKISKWYDNLTQENDKYSRKY